MVLWNANGSSIFLFAQLFEKLFIICVEIYLPFSFIPGPGNKRLRGHLPWQETSNPESALWAASPNKFSSGADFLLDPFFSLTCGVAGFKRVSPFVVEGFVANFCLLNNAFACVRVRARACVVG
jgi:hypothetical protein